MEIYDENLGKLLLMILCNKKLTLADDCAINRNFLIELQKNIMEDVGYFMLTDNEVDLLKKAFIEAGLVLTQNTPTFICLDDDCALASIKIDPNSIYYYEGNSNEVFKKSIELALEKKITLTDNSPQLFRTNFDIVITSITIDPFTVDHIDFYYFDKEQSDQIIKILLNSNYTLNISSSRFLSSNTEIILHSFELDKNSIRYVDEVSCVNEKLFKHLIKNGYMYNYNTLKSVPLKLIDSEEVLEKVLEQMEVEEINNPEEEIEYFHNNQDNKEQIEEFKKRYTKLLYQAMSQKPTISRFNNFFQYSAETSWNRHRDENISTYVNLFGKIRAELQSDNDFNSIINKLEFLYKMRKTLGEAKYDQLIKSMEEYYNIYHTSTEDMKNIDEPRNMISKLSAQFIAMEKEEWKKNILKDYYAELTEFFIPRKDNPVVKSRITKILQMNKLEACKLVYDQETIKFIHDLVEKYSNTVSEYELHTMINTFISERTSRLDKFIKAPYGYTAHKRKLEADKLVNRLNSKYIKYTDNELTFFRDIIKYDEEKDVYYYDGATYTDEQVEKYKKYREKQIIYEEIKKQIILRAKTIEVDYDSVNVNDYIDEIGELPFNDEYYEIDNEGRTYRVVDLYETFCLGSHRINVESILDDEAYNQLTNFIINNNIFWLFAFQLKHRIGDLYSSMDNRGMLDIMDNYGKILKISESLNYNISSFSDIKTLNNLSQCSDESAMAILGMDIIEKLCTYKEYTSSESSKKIIDMAKQLVCNMSKRSESTVPYVEGKTANYHYSIYDTQDVDLLLAGINTSACFRVDGVDNDFLHYCALNKNGVVIKITDEFGNFVARAAGFRNGNAVYFNQLRTINDIGGYGYRGHYEKERDEIIEAFKCACKDIGRTSMANENEKNKIEYIFVTQSYALRSTESNVDRYITDAIGSRPMVNESEDWKTFVSNTNNLNRCTLTDGFTVDYGGYSLICMYDAKNDKDYTEINWLENITINKKDVPALYKRPRNKIISTDKPNSEIIRKINKISGIFSHYTVREFIKPNITDASLIFVGDNWFIIIKDGEILQHCILLHDRDAVKEYAVTIRKLIKDKVIEEKKSETINDEEFSNSAQKTRR